MTDHETQRITAILDVHAQQMNDPTHRLLCAAEPCAIALLLHVIGRQCKALADVSNVALTCKDAVATWYPRSRDRVDARKTVEVLASIGEALHDIVRSD